MARIAGDIVIDRPVEVVFDYVADQSNEPRYNPQMVRAEKMTAGPVGVGTRFRSAVASMGRMRWSGQVRLKGASRLLGPMITWMGRRQERRIWTSLKHRLEASPADAGKPPDP